MNRKWYIGTLLLILAFIGLNQEQNKIANQQILLQFTDAETTSVSGHDDVLVTVTKKLEALGVADIQVIKNEDRQISIRYYSDIDALQIGNFLSQDNRPSLAHTKVDDLPEDYPEDKLPKSCSLVVSDIQQQANDAFNLNGKFSPELNQDYKCNSELVFLQFNNAIVFNQDTNTREAYKTNRQVILKVSNISYAIPEVRAGPRI